MVQPDVSRRQLGRAVGDASSLPRFGVKSALAQVAGDAHDLSRTPTHLRPS